MNENWKERAEKAEAELANLCVADEATQAGLAAAEDELKETKQLLAHKNETANTFMSQVKKLQAELANRRRFPIQGGPSVPWEVMAPHQSMAMANHSQTLERLAERGGLGSGEAWCVVSGIKLGCRGTKEQWDAWSAEWIKFAERVNLRCDELDRLRRQNHAMREALEWQHHECHTCHPGEQCPDVCVCSCPQCHMEHIKRNALKEDAGSALLTRESVMPLVEGLQNYEGSMWDCEAANVALSHARTLGLIDERKA